MPLLGFCIAQNHLKMCIWALRSAAQLGKGASFFDLRHGDRFWVPLRLLLGPFWDALGVMFGLVGANVRFVGAALDLFLVDVRFSLFDVPYWICALRFVDAALGPRPCGLRAARLNKIIELVLPDKPNHCSGG